MSSYPAERRVSAAVVAGSSFDTVDHQLPSEYANALLDEEYMEKFVAAVEHLNKKRKKAVDRYALMNKGIVIALVVWSVIGVAIGLLKAELQPPLNFMLDVNLEDVDMVVMLDASNHQWATSETQRDIVQTLTSTLFDRMAGIREGQQTTGQQFIKDAQKAYAKSHPSLGQKLGLDNSAERPGQVRTSGGYLRIATSLFNYDHEPLSGLTFSMQDTRTKLGSVGKDQYQGYSQWHTAMHQCKQILDSAPPVRYPGKAVSPGRCVELRGPDDDECHSFGVQEICPARYCRWDAGSAKCVPRDPLCRKQFCVVVGDSDAVCRGRGADRKAAPPVWNTRRQAVCDQFPGAPCYRGRDTVGNPLEYADEMQECTDFAKSMVFEVEPGKPPPSLEELNSHTNADLVMMFTASTVAEQQMRLRNPDFQEFIRSALDCNLYKEPEQVFLKNGKTELVDMWRPESCSRFIMETNLERLRERSASIASLLKSETVLDNVPNHNVDKSFRVFYAMPLCLVFFFGWARIIKWYSHLKLQAQRRMGATKKMIKVTKSLVEKQGIFLQRRMPGMEELELADFARLKRPIGMNSGILLRCRLKGSYLRTHPQGFADGHGHAFSTASTFVFECEGQAGPLQQGVPCSIRNFEGHALVVDRYGTRFLIDENEHATGPDFVVEPLDKGATGCFFGDTIRIKCLSTGMYLRISKDGDVDGAGQSSMAEVQLVVDVGGAPIESGAIVTLRGGAVLDCLHADPSGEVRIGGGSAQPPGYSAKDWTYWLIERQSEQCRSAPSDARSDGGLAAGRGTSHNTLSSEACAEPLQDGDIVSLKGLNQRFLEADVATGICRCTAGRGQNAAEAQLFVVHRLGVNRISKHNSAIRTGAEVCLKPVSRGDSAKSYLRSFGGRMSADGAVCDEGICLTIDVSSVQHVVEALSQALAEGDVAINCSPVWDKQEVRLVEGMSAAWTTAETLSTFRGAVVFARDDASYALPKGNAEWVGVVPDGVDLVKACQQAHSQGATGLVVRCDEPCCLERLAAFSDGDDAPVLPVVWVSQAVADAFQERGLVLNHCSVRRQHITDVMRAIGRFGGKQTKDAHAHAEIFTTVGAAMLLQHEDLCAQQRAQDAQQHEFDAQRQAVDESRRAEEPPPEKTYKWKITGNTDYLWAGTTYRGLPRAAAVPVKYNEPPPARTRLSVVHSDAREVRELRLGQELAEMMTQEQAEAAAQRHELSEERDFRVEYKFEEIECGIDETPADLDAAEFMVDQGAVVQAIGVPKDMFWMVICGLVAFTLLLAILLLVIFNGMKEPDMEGSPPPVGFEAAAASAARSAFATFVPGHLRHSHDSGLAASLVSENFLAHAQARRLFLSQRQ